MVQYVQQTLQPARYLAASYLSAPAVIEGSSEFKSLVGALQDIAVQISVAPRGLRRCNVCGENLATPVRMKEHLMGRRHCEEITRWYIQSSAGHSLNFTSEKVAEIFKEYGIAPLAACTAEPPDVALTILKEAMPSEKPSSAPRRKKDKVQSQADSN